MYAHRNNSEKTGKKEKCVKRMENCQSNALEYAGVLEIKSTIMTAFECIKIVTHTKYRGLTKQK